MHKILISCNSRSSIQPCFMAFDYAIRPFFCFSVQHFFVPLCTEGATDNARKDFLGEAQMLATFNHSNVMGLLKVVTKSEPVMVIIPFMTNGDLKNYLKRCSRINLFSIRNVRTWYISSALIDVITPR